MEKIEASKQKETEIKFEKLGETFEIAVSKEHKFGTDAFLLADFAKVRRKDSCCDLCTGCGIIPILWYRWGKNPKIAYGVELQKQGIEQLEISVKKNNLENILLPIHKDLKEITEIPKASLDLITCNPPFKNVGGGIPCPDPTRLTARHEVDCNLDDICKTASSLLNFGGRLCICQRPERIADIMVTMKKYNIEPKRMRLVQKLATTAPWLVLVEGKKGSKPFLQVEPPLIIEDGQGGYSPEMKKLYNI